MDTYLGEIRHFPFGFAPQGFLQCDGKLLSISVNSALYSLLGIDYGGDGRTTFAVPDLRGKSPLDSAIKNIHYYICVSGVYPSRA